MGGRRGTLARRRGTRGEGERMNREGTEGKGDGARRERLEGSRGEGGREGEIDEDEVIEDAEGDLHRER